MFVCWYEWPNFAALSLYRGLLHSHYRFTDSSHSFARSIGDSFFTDSKNIPEPKPTQAPKLGQGSAMRIYIYIYIYIYTLLLTPSEEVNSISQYNQQSAPYSLTLVRSLNQPIAFLHSHLHSRLLTHIRSRPIGRLFQRTGWRSNVGIYPSLVGQLVR